MLLVHGAEVVLAGAEGTRVVALKDFYRGMYETALEPGEILVEVRVPHVAAGARTVYSRFSSLSANDWPCIGVAGLLSLDNGNVSELRLGLSGVAEAPLLAADLDRFQGKAAPRSFGTRSATPWTSSYRRCRTCAAARTTSAR